MQLSDGEKLIATMLADLMIHLKAESEIDPEFVKRALPDNAWALSQRYPGLFSPESVGEEVAVEVNRILAMYSFIEYSIGRLQRGEADEFANQRFVGFDGNYEADHFRTAVFMAREVEHHAEFRDRGLNSHVPMLDTYRRMLDVFDRESRSAGMGRPFSADQLRRVLAAGDAA